MGTAGKCAENPRLRGRRGLGIALSILGQLGLQRRIGHRPLVILQSGVHLRPQQPCGHVGGANLPLAGALMGQRHHGGVVRLQGHGLDAHLHGAGVHRLLHQYQRMVLEERIVVGGQLRVVRQLGRRGDIQGGADVAVIGQPQPVHLPRHVGAVLPDGAVAGVAHGLGAAGGGGGGVRLGGGIGTRGPGEKKLEVDRRLIRERISKLSADLNDDIAHREVMRKQRLNSHIPIVSIVGYTNAGKSTLLNHMTQAGVLEEDKLFATLDPTSRNYKLPNGQEIILTDTVGFIRKLPHHLIDAFRSTLEEAKFADIILHVVDISNPQADLHILTVYDTLRELGVKDKPVVTLFNKIDKVDELPAVKDFQADHTLYISAKQETGFEKITDILTEIINQSRIYIEQTIPYAKAGVIQQIRKSGNLLEEEYREDGIFVRAYVDAGTKGLL